MVRPWPDACRMDQCRPRARNSARSESSRSIRAALRCYRRAGRLSQPRLRRCGTYSRSNHPHEMKHTAMQLEDHSLARQEARASAYPHKASKGRIALVSDANSGIGVACARHVAAAGATVDVSDEARAMSRSLGKIICISSVQRLIPRAPCQRRCLQGRRDARPCGCPVTPATASSDRRSSWTAA